MAVCDGCSSKYHMLKRLTSPMHARSGRSGHTGCTLSAVNINVKMCLLTHSLEGHPGYRLQVTIDWCTPVKGVLASPQAAIDWRTLFKGILLQYSGPSIVYSVCAIVVRNIGTIAATGTLPHIATTGWPVSNDFTDTSGQPALLNRHYRGASTA